MNKLIAVRHFSSATLMSHAAAEQVADTLISAVSRQGYATLVLSGGATPRQLYGLLAAEKYTSIIPWAKTNFFWGDERFVPTDHPDSNYRMAYDALLSHAPVAPENIFRIPVELGWLESASAYEATVRKFFHQHPGSCAGGAACFDLVLLGVGQDGHTAALFSGSPALDDERWVAAVRAPDGTGPEKRITMTPAVLNKADQVLFLAAEGKKEIAARVFEDAGGDVSQYPAAKIRAQGQVSMFISDGDYRACN
jgi:6-phosphogluconolactonase